MSEIILVTGGSRSGKSSYALGLAESRPGPWTFIATCPAVDGEMARKIEAHRLERDAKRWTTIEEEIDLAQAICRASATGVEGASAQAICRASATGVEGASAGAIEGASAQARSAAGACAMGPGARAGANGVILVDCLTLWVNNLMYRASLAGREVTEEEVAGLTDALVRAARSVPDTVFFVTNEVGLGIVPPDASTRLYRNLVGRCGQAIGAAADAAVLVVCGLAITLKGDPGS